MPISKEHFRHEMINLSSRHVLIMANSNYPICPERPCRHPKLSLEIGLTQFDPLLAEKSESENFTQIWLTRCQTLYIVHNS